MSTAMRQPAKISSYSGDADEQEGHKVDAARRRDIETGIRKKDG